MTVKPSPSIIGLTGGIASGKSTVAQRWRESGARIIDADQVARDVVVPGEPAHQAICDTFGTTVLTANQELDRPKLGRLVFSNPELLETLNQIVHPAMLLRIRDLIAVYRDQDVPWIVYEAALIIEKGLGPPLAELVCVVADPTLQRRRLMKRNALSEAEANDRLAAQTDNFKRRELSDFVIDNDGSLDALLADADRHFMRLEQTYGPL